MCKFGRFSFTLSLFIVCIFACKAGTQAKTSQVNQPQAPTAVTTINGAQGGTAVYGTVNGATTPAAAMTKLLQGIHTGCGEKPQIGKVFQFTGTNSVGVFFTVTDHSQGNKQMAGLLIAAPTGPNTAEAAMLSDSASNFAKSVNPLLQQLSNVWHPGGTGGSGSAAGGKAAASGQPASGQPAPLQVFRAQDNTGTVGYPAGWKPQGQNGTFMVYKQVSATELETVMLNLYKEALDPNNPNQVRLRSGGLGRATPGEIVLPSNSNLVQVFPVIFKQFFPGAASATVVQVDKSELMPGPQGQRCVHATGHAGTSKAMQEMNALLCAVPPSPMGIYGFSLSVSLLPPDLADKDRATAGAIMASFQPNEAVINRIAGQMAAPAIANIQAIGAAATARMNATEAANSAEQSNWEAGQNANAQNAAGFSNYLLDQTVIQNNSTGAHGTQWNSAADAMVQSNPSKYSYVSNSNYIQGTDF